MAALARGDAIDRPTYDFSTYTRVIGQTEQIAAGPFVVVEGLFALYYPNLFRSINCASMWTRPMSCASRGG